jgi:hypothetical protein
MSNTTSTIPQGTSSAPPSPQTSTSNLSQTANRVTPSTGPPNTSEPPTSPSSSNPPDPTSNPPPTTSNPPPTTTTPPPTSNRPPTTNPGPTVIVPGTEPGQTSTITTIITSTQATVDPSNGTNPPSSTTTAPINTGGTGGGGLGQGGTIAIAVVIPIIAVALLVLGGLFFWRRRKARKDAEEERRKEVEDYAYNPNNDPTIPSVGLTSDGPYEMREETTSGYRGWGSTTLAGSTGRKASTTMSGGNTNPYSDAASPTRGNVSDTRSGEPLIDGSYSPEGEILGAMGPSAAGNRGADVRRGPSNASSSYSAAARSDGSGDMGVGVAYSGSNPYYDQYGSNNPYAADTMYNPQRPSELPAGQPVIRDNPARRNTRIESPSHYPQQSAGISQNF